MNAGLALLLLAYYYCYSIELMQLHPSRGCWKFETGLKLADSLQEKDTRWHPLVVLDQ